MALLFVDSFNTTSSTKWDTGTTTYSVSTEYPRIPSGYSAYYGSSGSVYFNKFVTASAKLFVGFGLKPFVSSENAIYFYGDAGVTTHICVMRNVTTGFLEIRRGTSSGTLLATGSTSLQSSVWNYIEVSVTVSDTVGEVHVRLNGSATDDVSYTGDTKNAGTNTTLDRIRIATTGSTSASGRIADVYIANSVGSTNNTFLGDIAVRALQPSGNGTYSQLTGSDSNQVDNYALVDETPYSVTDYVGSPTTGQRDTYAMADLPAGVTQVYGVQVAGAMAKSDVTVASSKYALLTNGSLYYGATRTLNTSYAVYTDMFELNPNTSAGWTVSEVNAAEAGMEVA